MKRKRVAMTISIPPEMAEKYEKLARQGAKNKSQLFREMFQFYEAQALEKEFFDLQRKGVQLARARGIFTEKDVEKIVFEDR